MMKHLRRGFAVAVVLILTLALVACEKDRDAEASSRPPRGYVYLFEEGERPLKVEIYGQPTAAPICYSTGGQKGGCDYSYNCTNAVEFFATDGGHYVWNGDYDWSETTRNMPPATELRRTDGDREPTPQLYLFRAGSRTDVLTGAYQPDMSCDGAIWYWVGNDAHKYRGTFLQAYNRTNISARNLGKQTSYPGPSPSPEPRSGFCDHDSGSCGGK